MGIFDKLRKHRCTAHIAVNSHRCIACWECVDNCPRQVFGKISFLGHRHIKIINADSCMGCMKCTRICKQHAIIPLNGNTMPDSIGNQQVVNGFHSQKPSKP